MKNRPKPFQCGKCDYATDHKKSLKGHLHTHEKIIERCNKFNRILIKNKIHDCRLDCKFCGKKFSRRNVVLKHIKNHHTHEIGRSFYECDSCDLKFYLKKPLRTHMEAKHADGKIQTFTCDLDGKTFKLKEQIAKHMKIHLQPVKCDFCRVKVNIRHLRGHIKNFNTGVKSNVLRF